MMLKGRQMAVALLALAACGGSLEGAQDVRVPGHPEAELSFRIVVGTFGTTGLTQRVAAPSNMKSVTVAEKEGLTAIVWRGNDAFGPDFTVKATLEPRLNGEIRWTFAYSMCTSVLPVLEVHFPLLTVPRTDATKILYPRSIGAIRLPDWKSVKPGERLVSAIPQTFHFIAALTDGGDSWYMDQRGAARLQTGLSFTAHAGQRPGTVTLRAVCEPPARAVRDWQMPFDGTIARFPGGEWFTAVEIYRAWAKQQPWYAAARGRDFGRMREIAMWFWNRGAADHAITPVERFQEAAGVPAALDWYWWHAIPYDTGFPNFWPPREGEVAFRQAVRRCSDAGIFLQVYTNGMTWDIDDPSWTEGGEDGVIVRRDGTRRAVAFNRFMPHRLAFMCGSAERYQARMRALYRTLAGTGLPGIYMDMIGNASYGSCYAAHHAHAPGGGEHCIMGNRLFAQRIKRENPGICLSTEDASESYLDVFDSGICLACNGERFGNDSDTHYAVPVNQAIYHGCEVLFGSYAMVHGIPPFDAKWPTDRKWKEEKDWKSMFPDQFALELSRGVTWGMQPTVHNFRPGDDADPRFAEDYRLMIDTARFYHAHRDLLFSGEMLAPGRLACECQKIGFLVRGTYAREGEYATATRTNVPAILHSVWRSPDGSAAAVLFNWTRQPRRYSLKAPTVCGEGELPPRSWRLVR